MLPDIRPWNVGVGKIAGAAIERAARAYEISPRMVRSRSNEAHIVAARKLVMKELRALGWSFPRIGRAVGGMHHSTVLYHLRKPQPQPVMEPVDPSGVDVSGEWAI